MIRLLAAGPPSSKLKQEGNRRSLTLAVRGGFAPRTGVVSSLFMDEITLQNALAQAEAAFSQVALQALESEDHQEQASQWRELARTYDKTLAWWPRQGSSFRRLMTLRDWARRLGTENG